MKRILWFRRDLRVKDNKILSFDGEVLPIFIFDKNILQHLDKEDKRVSFIYFYVMKLKRDLQKLGLDLKIFYDTPQNVFERLLQEYDFDEVIASGDYDTYAKQRDREISHKLHFRYLNETYLFKPNEVLKKDGTPYLVFTPFFKEVLKQLPLKELSCTKIGDMKLLDAEYDKQVSLEEMGFVKKDVAILSPYEKLEKLKQKLPLYKTERDFMMRDATSHLSVDLRFGTVGVREIFRELCNMKESLEFIRELVFREFYGYLLFHFPSLETHNFKYTFNGVYDQEKYEKFIKAKTGVPIVDAGLRELLETGYMHNRVRMIVASFFTKDLLLPWQFGEAFFAKHLLDYDKASNVLSWQWSAGTGVDPQPYFRVFNPYLQSKKFDKEGLYIKKYMPELKELPSKYLHDEAYLLSKDIPNYPKPMVVHKEAVKKAVESFKN
ncbi:deoxyribodipyrimidine photo-lyase [Sulfurimonas marina]|uniref:Deoxyribodipyrimidine photo-lyase n=2 Tax=Sulfurimonas marina TaxID=2590551 RepID=A0A7M1AY89_9BACT|nr:deoxyribodipyrimidine photo-lyase [Sulfurimonas marina]